MEPSFVPEDNLSPKKLSQIETTKNCVVLTKLPDLEATQDISPTTIIENQELLGSVTTFTPKQGSSKYYYGISDTIRERKSARVIQKLKQDLIRPPTPPPDKKEHSSDRPAPKTPNQAKPVRNFWTNLEKSYFFDALNEYGKDFELITVYINTRTKRKSLPNFQAKSREQIRVFYYQSLQKVSKYLKFSGDVKKLAKELYTLINYGEMRKKLVFVSDKFLLKLQNLVYNGWVQIRTKGKNVKIQTPACKALQQLNQLEEWKEEIDLPQRVDIFLKPINIDVWGTVQNLAHNPRVKMTLPIQRRVASVIKTLQSKWRINDNKLCETTLTMSYHHPLTPGTNELKLRLLPLANAKIHRPMVCLADFFSSRRISLNSYEERIGVKVKGAQLATERVNELKDLMKLGKRQRCDSGSLEKKNAELKKVKLENEAALKVEPQTTEKPIELDKNKPDTKIEIKIESNSVEPQVNTTNLIVPKEPENIIIEKTENKPTAPVTEPVTVNPCKKKRKKFRPLMNEDVVRSIREGWNLENVGDMAVGDLYIMFGGNLSIHLEYTFDGMKSVKIPQNAGQTSKDATTSTPSTSTESTIKTEEPPTKEINGTSEILGNKLKQLIFVASLMEQKRNVGTGVKTEETSTSFVSNTTLFSHPTDNSFFRSPVPPVRKELAKIPVADQYQHINSLRAKQPRWLKIRSHRPIFNNNKVLLNQRNSIPDLLSFNYNNRPKSTLKLPQPSNKIFSPTSNNSPRAKIQIVESKTGVRERNLSKVQADGEKKPLNDDKSATNHFKSIWNGVNFNSVASTSTKAVKEEVVSVETVTHKKEKPSSPPLSEFDSNFMPNINDNSGIRYLMDITLPSPVSFDRRIEDSSPSVSNTPMKMLKELMETPAGENEWEESDMSFSSFLGHLDNLVTPEKKPSEEKCESPTNLVRTEIDCSNLSVISESAADYMSKFQQITEELKGQN